MTYFVKEIFYTLQGEGMNAGRPAVFLRFSGCNLAIELCYEFLVFARAAAHHPTGTHDEMPAQLLLYKHFTCVL